MSGLIYSDSAINEISRFDGYLDDDMILRLQIAIKMLPTVDAVPVVRCRDCKHNSKNGGTCDHVCIDANDEWFCADGEKETVGIYIAKLRKLYLGINGEKVTE